MKALTLQTDLVYPNPEQPRKFFDTEKLEELANSIKEHGQLQPGRVRPDGNGKFMIVMGERRYRACRLADVPYQAIIDEELSDVDLAEQAIVENLQRSNVTPMEEARAFQSRLDTGMTVEELAKRLGIKRPSFIQGRVELLKLRPEYQKALDQGNLTVGQAQQLATLTGSSQDQLFRMIDTGKLKSYKEVVSAAQEFLAAEQQTDMFNLTPISKKELKKAQSVENKLQKDLDRVTRFVNKGFNDGEIIILRKVNPDSTKKMADQIKMIRKHLQFLEDELRRSSIANEIQNIH